MNKAPDLIFSDEVVSNLDAFVSKDVTKCSLDKGVFLESVKEHKVACASGITSVLVT